MKKYLEFTLFESKYALRYRMDSVVMAFTNLISFFAFFFLWKTVYGIKATGWSYSFREMATYYLITNLLYSYSMTCWGELSWSMRNGYVVNLLSKPIDIFKVYLFRNIGYSGIYMVMNLFIDVFIVLFMREYIILNLNAYTLILMLLFWIGGGLFKFSVEYIVEISAFWWKEVSGLRAMLYFIQAFLSGAYIPLNLVMGKSLLSLIPYNYIAYFPARIYMGKFTNAEIYTGFVGLVIWNLIVILLGRFITRKGMKIYTAPGV
jgi:ABC-2 type transport system permease protein